MKDFAAGEGRLAKCGRAFNSHPRAPAGQIDLVERMMRVLFPHEAQSFDELCRETYHAFTTAAAAVACEKHHLVDSGSEGVSGL